MELNESDQSFLEELLALRRETEMNEIFSSGLINFDCFDHQHVQNNENFLTNYSSSHEQQFSNYGGHFNNEVYYPLAHDQFSRPTNINNGDSSYTTLEGAPFSQDYPISNMEEEELEILADEIHNLEVQANNCKVEPVQSPEVPLFNTGMCFDHQRKNPSKKLQGQPSKNLMAERRRRKRLNDRLSMLRSIVPKISKMDRTAILGDAIDYMKELLEKINNLQREIELAGSDDQFDMNIFKDVKPNAFSVRNSPKFDVERRSSDTRIEICCAAKPGLLLSTVNTLEALGLEIQQCVISCFNDFALQASCSEETEHRTTVSHDEIKQALFRNAGYGGRCL